MNEQEKLLNARDRFIDSMAKNMSLYGITHSVGRLYGLLYFNEKPMTLDEMKDELGMSKTSMSTAVRQLQELNMVEKVWKKGERKDLYQAADDWYDSFTALFTTSWRTGISLNMSTINRSLKELHNLRDNPETPDEVRASVKLDIEKYQYALDYYDWLNRFVDSLESKEIFNYIPKKE
ncbi:GbsR/MarR family transcriptional regulator [Robertmurraya korlensis]|uniref:GbsR/MarR family transcriptional regulator n=1 Tax=Robertmurraya korlensis TaxID=519977 RepID=UPI000B10B5A4|nr:GbsR/MarR family transcriptional regulator [Robertmurraya korlensis]